MPQITKRRQIKLSMDILPEEIRLAFNEWNTAYSRAYSYLNKNRDLSISKARPFHHPFQYPMDLEVGFRL